MEGRIQRTRSDISTELLSNKEPTIITGDDDKNDKKLLLPTISELAVEEIIATCECCGMSEECTVDYMTKMRDQFMGKLICGLCAEAVKEEVIMGTKNGRRRRSEEEALNEHMSACEKFNRLGRSYPVLYQADAIKQILKKSSSNNRATHVGKNGRITRSSSCIPAISTQ